MVGWLLGDRVGGEGDGWRFCGGGGVGFGVGFFAEPGAKEREYVVEVAFEDDSDALGCQGALDVVVLVVVAVVGFESDCSHSVEEVFDVEVADE